MMRLISLPIKRAQSLLKVSRFFSLNTRHLPALRNIVSPRSRRCSPGVISVNTHDNFKMIRGISSSRVDELLSDSRRHFDYQTLMSRKKDGPLLIIDVREPAEITETGNIPGSINIPLADVEEALGAVTPEAFRMRYGGEKPSKGMLIVFSCKSGRRSVTALGKALQMGFLNAAHYKGGWMDWEKQSKQN